MVQFFSVLTLAFVTSLAIAQQEEPTLCHLKKPATLDWDATYDFSNMAPLINQKEIESQVGETYKKNDITMPTYENWGHRSVGSHGSHVEEASLKNDVKVIIDHKANCTEGSERETVSLTFLTSQKPASDQEAIELALKLLSNVPVTAGKFGGKSYIKTIQDLLVTGVSLGSENRITLIPSGQRYTGQDVITINYSGKNELHIIYDAPFGELRQQLKNMYK